MVRQTGVSMYLESSIMEQQFENALLEAKDRIRDMDESIERIIDKKYPKQTSVGGTINNVYFGTSIERIVIYVCITIVLVVWLS